MRKLYSILPGIERDIFSLKIHMLEIYTEPYNQKALIKNLFIAYGPRISYGYYSLIQNKELGLIQPQT